MTSETESLSNVLVQKERELEGISRELEVVSMIPGRLNQSVAKIVYHLQRAITETARLQEQCANTAHFNKLLDAKDSGEED